MRPQDLQIPKGMVLILNGDTVKKKIKSWCDIMNFQEPADVLNVGGSYEINYQVQEWHGEPKYVRAMFHSKTYADNFVALLQAKGATIQSGPTFKTKLAIPEMKGKKLVKSDGSIEAAIRGIV